MLASSTTESSQIRHDNFTSYGSINLGPKMTYDSGKL